ncbi:integrase core domain-containing protein [Rhodococcus aetherivorans]|uniref:integrase core domain-containing protein n=1 Tax=Rhodococcus aetherivorans TaxID=191292 RepID=UPI00374EE037
MSSSGSSRSSVHDVLTSGGTPECLNRNYWPTLLEARVVIEDFKDDHNHRHRHSALRNVSRGLSPVGVRRLSWRPPRWPRDHRLAG